MQNQRRCVSTQTATHSPCVVNAPVYRHADVYRKYGPENCHNIMRGSDWGNPFVLYDGLIGDRDYVCNMFEKYAKWRLTIEPDWLKPLRGKILICCCKPKRCHGDTLLRLANKKRN